MFLALECPLKRLEYSFLANYRSLPLTEQSSGTSFVPSFQLCSAVTLTLMACQSSRSSEIACTLALVQAALGKVLAVRRPAPAGWN